MIRVDSTELSRDLCINLTMFNDINNLRDKTKMSSVWQKMSSIFDMNLVESLRKTTSKKWWLKLSVAKLGGVQGHFIKRGHGQKPSIPPKSNF